MKIYCLGLNGKDPDRTGNPNTKHQNDCHEGTAFFCPHDSYFTASWLVTLFQVGDGTAGGMAL